MEAEGDVIDAVFGDGQDYLEVSSTAPFYQHERGGNSANELQRSDVQTIAGLKYDSWVTIGYEDNYMNALTAFLMDFSEFEPAVACTPTMALGSSRPTCGRRQPARTGSCSSCN